MGNQPLLTIITVTYNAGLFVGRTLESAQHALEKIVDKSSVEYLIIDGKSSDETLSIAKQYKTLVSKVISEKDNGLYDAMNKGIKISSGRYLWFLNAGDEIADENALVRLFKELESGGDVYYSDAIIVRDTGEQVGLRSEVTPHLLPRNLKWQDFALGMKVCHQAFIAKKEIAPLYHTDNLSADIDWEISCLKSSKSTHYLPFTLCKYLLGGLSTQNHRRSLVDRFFVLRKHFGTIPTVFNHIKILWRGYKFSRRNGRYW
jgi:glycosyltransferase involved in cell wall biosynthesis